MKHYADIERTCRLRGKTPTQRERWNAFYRVWRLIRNNCSAQLAEDGGEALRVLMSNWRFIQLVQSLGDHYDLLRFMPKPIRWSMVGRELKW